MHETKGTTHNFNTSSFKLEESPRFDWLRMIWRYGKKAHTLFQLNLVFRDKSVWGHSFGICFCMRVPLHWALLVSPAEGEDKHRENIKQQNITFIKIHLGLPKNGILSKMSEHLVLAEVPLDWAFLIFPVLAEENQRLSTEKHTFIEIDLVSLQRNLEERVWTFSTDWGSFWNRPF